ncbi:peptidase M50 [Halovivax asiaticus JCM 14624]|uniref:Zinc metalloprotease n=1 Tax=Halovivax asiaticus JCM 14624 TaxID=1227490 RepID=M0BP99_9EURY|nr:site-2 protease family protein [Halovivax asiaticus]ELZ12302.1 peptidase M50 [Halovivax asiaticus JCM 14624]
MWKSFRIGSLFGIPIKLDVTFLLILPVFAVLIGRQIEDAAGIFNEVLGAEIQIAALTGGLTPYLWGLVAAVGLFAGVVLHELGHSLTAQRFGYPIDSITLWLLGGVASLTDMPENWRQEFAIAIAGPTVSMLLGIGSFALFQLLPFGWAGLRFTFAYLAILNVVLAVFNLLPAFPMDGGRVLRALLARNQPYAKATRQAATVGKFFAVLMGLFGLFAWNPLLIAVALFVYIAASGESQQVTMKAAFQDVTVADIMTPADRLQTVGIDTSVEELVQRMFQERHTAYPVLDGGRLVGIATLSDARNVKPVEREAYTVEEIMRNEPPTVEPAADVMGAIEQMRGENVGQLLVVTPDAGWNADGSELIGIISRSDVMTALDVVQQSGSVTPMDKRLAD